MQSVRVIFLIFLITLPLGTRLLVGQLTPGFHEYEALFVYLSDITLLGFFGFYIFKLRAIGSRVRGVDEAVLFYLPNRVMFRALVIFLAFAAVSVFASAAFSLSLYSLTRLLLLVFLALTIGKLVNQRKIFERVLAVLVVLAVLESLIGILQFKFQNNLGLSILGESPISREAEGVSRVTVGSTQLIRAYGTFPHPNILAAFLLLGLLALFHFYIHTGNLIAAEGTNAFITGHFYRRLALSAGIFVVAIGLVLTFSRAAWLTGFLATLPFVIYGLYRESVIQFKARVSRWRLSRFWFDKRIKPSKPEINPARRLLSLKFLVVLLAVNYFIFAILGWAVFPRVSVSASEPAVTYRLEYNRLGGDLIKKHPIFGVGIGDQVFYSYKSGTFKSFGLDQSWQWAPIHNLYVLMASEIGLLGLLSFLVFVGTLIWQTARGSMPLEKITTLTLLGSLLILGLFDHFLWTIQAGRLMLWLVIGLAIAFVHFKTELPTESKEEF